MDLWGHFPSPQITWTARFGSQAGDIQPAEVQQEVVVSYLPLSHIAAQIYDLWTGIQWGAQVCFADPDALKVGLSSWLPALYVCPMREQGHTQVCVCIYGACPVFWLPGPHSTQNSFRSCFSYLYSK